jgi:hypothetical protein
VQHRIKNRAVLARAIRIPNLLVSLKEDFIDLAAESGMCAMEGARNACTQILPIPHSAKVRWMGRPAVR